MICPHCGNKGTVYPIEVMHDGRLDCWKCNAVFYPPPPDPQGSVAEWLAQQPAGMSEKDLALALQKARQWTLHRCFLEIARAREGNA